jgi:serine/threonine protein phosphatase PrpC
MMGMENERKVIQFSYSEIGTRHEKLNLENQDSVFVGKVCDDTYCLAVADGVSSCKWAKKGSEAAVDTVKRLALKLSKTELRTDDSDEIRRFVVRDWKNHFEGSWNDYGTTLNFVVWCKGDAVIGQIGDGLIISKLNDEQILLTDMDEFYTVETYALAEVVLKSSFKVRTEKNVKNLVAIAMTDGIGKELDLKSIDALQSCLVALVKEKERDTEIALWMNHLREKNDDDKTIGLLVLEGEA